MSSRQSKSSRKSTTATRKPATTVATPVAPATRTNGAATVAPVVARDPDAPYLWTHDYDYVKKDLTKLAAVSVTLFVIIILAGFFIR